MCPFLITFKIRLPGCPNSNASKAKVFHYVCAVTFTSQRHNLIKEQHQNYLMRTESLQKSEDGDEFSAYHPLQNHRIPVNMPLIRGLLSPAPALHQHL